MKYYVAARENGERIEEVATVEDGIWLISYYEELDIEDGVYEPDFYDIVDEEYYSVI